MEVLQSGASPLYGSDAVAGVVYVTDAQAAGDKVDTVEIPTAQNVTTKYPIATIKGSGNAAEAKRFVSYLQTAPAQAILAKYGFKKP